jgi:hypothetical protein
VGCGGIVERADTGTTGGAGIAAGVSTSTKVNGYWPTLADAARRISTPVGPLDGKLAHAVNPRQVHKTTIALRNEPLRCGTQEINID